jgi:diguanylate cyclase (GGDEF)-like protein/PAS domain S-box-containing protein
VSLSQRLRDRDSENRRSREELILWFRFGAAVFATVQTTASPGDSPVLSWIVVSTFWASILGAKVVLSRWPTDRRVAEVGVVSMVVDCLVVTSVMVNNTTDPAEPVYLVGILAVVEATMRWPRYGGAAAGVVAGLAAGTWTIAVYDRIGQPPEMSFASMRAGVIITLGAFFGALTRRLSDRHREIERILDASRDLIATLDPDGVVRSVNGAVDPMLGYRPSDVIGRDCREFLDPDQPIDLEDAALLSRLEPGARPLLALRRFRRFDGTFRWLELSVSSDPSTGVVYVTGRDVTERLDVERQVSMSEQRFRSLFDHNADAVYSFDVEGRFTAANPATERLTGYSAAELCGDTFTNLIAEEHRERTQHRFQLALGGDSQNYDTVVIARDGRRIELDVTNMPIVVDDSVVGVFGVAKDVTGRRRLERELSHQATHDSLTGLANRLLLEKFLERALAARSGDGATLLFVDLDRFKVVNDALGHRSGDELLVLVVERLKRCLRQGDVLVRWAGDEFCVLLEGDTSEAEALAVADRLLSAIAVPFAIAGRDVRVSASVGLAHSEPADTPERLVQKADTAMYRAKRAGRNRVCVHERGVASEGPNPIDFEMELREAIDSERLVIEYQPIFDLGTGEVSAVESLIRWPLPDGSVRGPDEFISAAEESGLIRAITRWVIAQVCRQLARWDEEIGGGELCGWVNVSGVDLQDPEFVPQIVDALAAAGLGPDRLVLEVTESMLLQDLEQVDRTVDALRRLGVALAIDDFGTGYSSMSQLHRLRVAACKIDRSFVTGAPVYDRDLAIIRSLSDIGAVFGFDVVGEGVETPEQLRALEGAGCRFAQGFLLAEPTGPVQIAELLTDDRAPALIRSNAR